MVCSIPFPLGKAHHYRRGARASKKLFEVHDLGLDRENNPFVPKRDLQQIHGSNLTSLWSPC